MRKTYAEILMADQSTDDINDKKTVNPFSEAIKSGLVSNTENGDFALTSRGMAYRQKSHKNRGGALVALDQQLVPSRPMMKKLENNYLDGTNDNDPRVTVANQIHMNKRIGKDQGIKRDTLINMFYEAIEEGNELNQLSEQLADLVVLGFHVRDIEYGKGERQLFYWFLIEIMQLIPETVLMRLIPMIPDFGSWLDFPRLAEICDEDIKTKNKVRSANAKKMYNIMVAFYGESLRRNMDLAPEERNLCGKWATRINSHFDKTCGFGKAVAKYLFPNMKDNRNYSKVYMAYRKMITAQTEGKCVEVLMADKNWREIADNLKNITGKAMYKYRKAFRDEILYGTQQGERRNPYDEDKTYLIQKLDEAIARAIECPEENIIKGGKTLQAYEIVSKYLNGGKEDPVLEAQWVAIVHELKAPIEWANKLSIILLNLTDEGVPIRNKDTLEAAKFLRDNVVNNLKKMGKDASLVEKMLLNYKSNETISMIKQELIEMVREWTKMGKAFDGDVSIIDTSGSMNGVPMEVAISLGLLVAECQSEKSPWKSICITFSEDPQWHYIKGESLFDRVNALKKEGRWGNSTNFAKTMNMILKHCVTMKVKEEFIPKRLWCFTDMQFNRANNEDDYYGYGEYQNNHSVETWQTAYTKAKTAFKNAGYSAPPSLSFWNIRSSNGTTQCQSDDKGLTTYGGFSQAMFKSMIYSEEVDIKEITPWERLKTTLDNHRYMVIREILDQSDENMIKDYKLPVEEEKDEVVDSDSDWEVLV